MRGFIVWDKTGRMDHSLVLNRATMLQYQSDYLPPWVTDPRCTAAPYLARPAMASSRADGLSRSPRLCLKHDPHARDEPIVGPLTLQGQRFGETVTHAWDCDPPDVHPSCRTCSTFMHSSFEADRLAGPA